MTRRMWIPLALLILFALAAPAAACSLCANLQQVPTFRQTRAAVAKATTHSFRNLPKGGFMRCPTCLGFGPRYLHSTGQAYKGGPNSGVFLTLTCDHAEDVPLENRKLSFGAVELAQAQGDFEVLNERSRRAMRVHLDNLSRGLGALREAFEQALP